VGERLGEVPDQALTGRAVASAGTTGISTSSTAEVSDGTILGLPAVTAASGSLTDTYFVCPSVSTNNRTGMWVIGHHGGYYVLVPTQGPDGSKVFINIPTHVANQAQVPAGWARCRACPSAHGPAWPPFPRSLSRSAIDCPVLGLAYPVQRPGARRSRLTGPAPRLAPPLADGAARP